MREKLGVLQGEGGEDSAISIPREPGGVGGGGVASLKLTPVALLGDAGVTT